MVDLRPEHVQGPPDVLGRPFLPGVGHPVKPMNRRLFEDRLEPFRWVAGLGGVEAHADETIPVWEGQAQGFDGRLGAQVTEEAQDQVRGDTEPPLSVE